MHEMNTARNPTTLQQNPSALQTYTRPPICLVICNPANSFLATTTTTTTTAYPHTHPHSHAHSPNPPDLLLEEVLDLRLHPALQRAAVLKGVAEDGNDRGLQTCKAGLHAGRGQAQQQLVAALGYHLGCG